MRAIPLLLMLPGALLYFGSNFLADFLMESVRMRRQGNFDLTELFGVPPEPSLPDQAEADKLQQDQFKLLAKIIGFVIFNLGVLTLFIPNS